MTARSISDLLRDVATFRDVPPDLLSVVSGCAHNVHYEAGRRILHEGDPADTFFALREGRVALEVFAPARGAVVIETIGPGEVLGWSWLFPPYRWHFDAVALDPVRAVAFDGACLRGKCDDDPRLGYELTRRFASTLIDRLQATRLRLLDVYGEVDAVP